MAGRLLLLSSSLLLSFIAMSSISAASPFYPPVFDINGGQLKLGQSYYIFSGAFLLPVGICKDEENVIQCPLTNGDPRGVPVVFTPVTDYDNKGKGKGKGKEMADTVIRENTFYNVYFVSLDLFTEDTYWYLKEGQLANQMFVAEGPEYLATKFAIRKVGLAGYKVVYCVQIPIPRIPLCYVLGFNLEEGYNRLGIGLGVRATQFFFKKNATCPLGDLCS